MRKSMRMDECRVIIVVCGCDRKRSSDAPVVVAILRDVRFTNPNALLADFVELVEEHRALVEKRFSAGCDRCAFVLLSRTELAIPQISSPVVLPEWFPSLRRADAGEMWIERPFMDRRCRAQRAGDACWKPV